MGERAAATPKLSSLLEDEDQPRISPAELAAYWGVSVATIRRDIAKGALKAFRLPGGRWRIKPSDARAYGRPAE